MTQISMGGDTSMVGHNSTVNFPSDKESLSEIKKTLEDISDSMTRVAGERDLIKEKKKALKEKFALPPKLVTKLAKTLFNDDFDVSQSENDDFVVAYNRVLGN